MKYIIDIEEKPLCVFDKDTQTCFPRLWRVKGFNSLVFDEDGLSRLEELNSDYINEHFGDLQDTAYQRGLNDAWEAAKKIVEMTDPPYWEVFDEYKNDLFGKVTASEAIEKLKAYEEKQKADEDVKRGDILRNKTNGLTYIVTLASDYGYVLLGNDGNCATTCITNTFEKTGKHFDIDKILEEMQT